MESSNPSLDDLRAAIIKIDELRSYWQIKMRVLEAKLVMIRSTLAVLDGTQRDMNNVLLAASPPPAQEA